jgi:hypothetical protein
MRALHPPKAVLGSAFGLIAKRLRDETAVGIHAPIPARWVELIHLLNELEQARDKKKNTSGADPPENFD